MPIVAPSYIEQSWLVEPIHPPTFETVVRYELDRAGLAEKDKKSQLDRMLSGPRKEWEDFISIMQEDNDELWYFRSSQVSWNTLSGRAGIAILRHGTIIKAYVTMMS